MLGSESTSTRFFTKIKVRGRKVKVPRWVAHSEKLPNEAYVDLVDVPLNYKVIPRPTEFPHDENTGVSWYRQHLPQCSTSRLVPFVHSYVQAGLASAGQFLQDLRCAYDTYWGSTGTSPGMQEVHRAMACCFDLEAMVHNFRPTQQMIDAFLSFAKSLRGKLALIAFPSPDIFPYVQRQWPANKELTRQYKVFCRVIHTNRKRPEWQEVVGLLVEPVHENRMLSRCVSRMFLACHVLLPVKQQALISHVVQGFLSGVCGSFQVKVSSCLRLGSMGGTNKTGNKRGFAAQFSVLRAGGGAAVGQFAVLKVKPHFRKVVRVVSELTELLPEAVAASFALDPQLHQYSSDACQKTTHCWHATTIFLFGCSMQSASSSCERVGSALHHISPGESSIHAGSS